MMYEIAFHSRVKKDIKKLDFPIQRELKDNVFPLIQEDPEVGEMLIGDLTEVFSYHFEKNDVQYRVAYTIQENTVYVLMVGKRENFYDALKRRL